MAEVIIMPKLGFNMDKGQLLKWHKQVGQAVSKGETLFEINTDKTTMPVEATMDGFLLQILLLENSFAPVFTPIAVIGEQGEDPTLVLAEHKGVASDSPQSNQEPLQVEPNKGQVDIQALRLSPKARKLAKEAGYSPEELLKIQGTGFEGGITEKDIKASPLARNLAKLHQVDLQTVSGSGSAGKIMKADVLAVASASGKTAPTEILFSPEKQIATTKPYTGIRKIIGDKLAHSKFTAPHLYFTDALDTTELTALRTTLNQVAETKIAVSDLLIAAVRQALRKFPQVNVSLVEDQVVEYESINIGLAVAGEAGLIVPVVKNTQIKTLSAIAVESRDLVARAQAGRLLPHEFCEGTFTISNLGMFGIENFTAIINPPEAAILAVSSVRKKPVVVTDEHGEDSLKIRPMMNIQLSVDHRLIDGLLAAKFVGYLKELLETPIKILI